MTPRDEMLLQMAAYLEREAPSRDPWDGNEPAVMLEIATNLREAAKAVTPIAGYVIAERHASGPNAGRLDIDWDGEVHESREAAQAELAQANAPLSDGPTQTPSNHWKLYELREVVEFGTSMHAITLNARSFDDR